MVINESALADIRLKYKSKRITLAVGAFDILHPGHIEYLTFAKRQGDILVVALPSDESVKSYKGKGRPFVDEQSRAAVIDALGMVDIAVVVDLPYIGLTTGAATLLKPDAVVVYVDWPSQHIENLKIDVAPAKVAVYANEKKHSTSEMIQKIQSRPS
jgi:rfaE bifunctional protein nucleotidyltransferase chain/domain